MLKHTLIALALLFLTVPAFAEEGPTMHQVYLAAEAGKFAEAQSMMDKVLRDHPNSAKAHFVEAELLAKQGLLSKAEAELNIAERLQPGLSFAKPETVSALKARISSLPSRAEQANSAGQSLPASIKDWMPWILLILGIGLIIWLISYFSQRNSRSFPSNSYAGNPPVSNIPPTGPVGTGGQVMGQPTAGGAGSGILGSLATGAALGAGVVAGEALMHHFLDGDKNEHVVPEPPRHDTSSWTQPTNIASDDNDMGGMDFGIDDSSSWDDDIASDDSGDDWT